MTAFRISIGYQLVERDARGFNRRIDLYSFGRSAHGAAPQHGTHAILQATDFLQQAIESGFELRFTKLDGGDAINKVPDRAMSEFYLTSHQFEDFKRFFREMIRQHGRERAFRVELGGLGDMGVRFLPDGLFPCVSELLRVIREMNASFQGLRDEGFDPPHSTINLGRLRQRLGGMDLSFDLRTVPSEKPEEIESRLAASIQQVATQYPSLNITLARERSTPSLEMTKDHELVRICREAQEGADLPVALGQKSSSTEAAQWFQAGFEAVVFGSGSLVGNSHGPNEYNSVEQIEKSVAFYESLIERVCL
jgi:acetylornithine deacetylase/succinyl-diaminopimelate desuccinylase-like protein